VAIAEAAERFTAMLWLLLAVAGVATRVRRLRILYAFVCTDPNDIRYHRSVIRSSWLRLFAKTILFLGGLLIVWLTPTVPDFPTDLLFWSWRVGMIVVLLLLLLEDTNVDRVRRLLGTLESGRWEES
jgi:sterol desaturase/sphingolipid hydroxylase (fatty acid hydroxylase superfamily)